MMRPCVTLSSASSSILLGRSGSRMVSIVGVGTTVSKEVSQELMAFLVKPLTHEIMEQTALPSHPLAVSLAARQLD